MVPSTVVVPTASSADANDTDNGNSGSPTVPRKRRRVTRKPVSAALAKIARQARLSVAIAHAPMMSPPHSRRNQPRDTGTDVITNNRSERAPTTAQEHEFCRAAASEQQEATFGSGMPSMASSPSYCAAQPTETQTQTQTQTQQHQEEQQGQHDLRRELVELKRKFTELNSRTERLTLGRGVADNMASSASQLEPQHTETQQRCFSPDHCKGLGELKRQYKELRGSTPRGRYANDVVWLKQQLSVWS